MANLRVVFMGTPDFAVPCLEMLVQENYDIAAVVTQPDRPKGRGQKLMPSPVKECALVNGLTVLQTEKIKTPAFEEQLAALRPDVIIVVAFGQILSKNILELPPLGCVNVHASLLPKYRGAAPIHWSVINGETVTGITTMFMDIGLDTGDMILKAEVAIGNDETTGEVHNKLKILGAQVLKDTIQLLVQNKAPHAPQDHNAATYAPLLTRSIERIDWQRPAAETHNLVRGLNPWPGAYCYYKNKILKIWRTKLHEAELVSSSPGRINKIMSDGIVIETGLGALEIVEVQPESKRRMTAWDCASGYCINVGETLE